MTELRTHNHRSNSGKQPPPQVVAETATDPSASAWGSVAFGVGSHFWTNVARPGQPANCRGAADRPMRCSPDESVR